MRHIHNIKTLHDEYGIEYEGIYRRSASSEKFCARFFKGDKEIWRNIYKG